MTTEIVPEATLAELVTAHPDLAVELERRTIDYCCGGGRTLREACRSANLDPDLTARELGASAIAPPSPWASLGPGALVDHIEATHHAYLHAELPRVALLAAKVNVVHGVNHVELRDVEAAVTELQGDLEPHLEEEERVLFPMIRELAAADEAPAFRCGSLENPIGVMLREHDRAGELLERLRALTNGYAVPADGCASYAALYRALEDLESDTHLHVHIENNRLFPMAIELEAKVLARSAGGRS